MKHTIYFTRHGQSTANVTMEIALPTDNLTEKGRQEVGLLGEDLKNEKFTKVFSSDYVRAMQTTEIILEKNMHADKNLKIITSKHIRENHLGILEEKGGSAPQMLEPMMNYFKEHGNFDEFVAAPGAESVNIMRVRAKRFYIEELFPVLDKASSPENILVTSHGIIIWVLMGVLKQLDNVEILNWEPTCGKSMARNAVYNKLEISSQNDDESRKIKFLAVHEYSHLVSLEYEESGLVKLAKSPKGEKLQSCMQV